jgi:Domain of Unknown Function (DUF1080)
MLYPTNRLSNIYRYLFLFGLAVGGLEAAVPPDNYFGRWALTLSGDRAGWLEIKAEKGWYDGSLLWVGGSVTPLASVAIVDGELTVTRLREITRKGPAGIVVRQQQATETLSGRLDGDLLKLTRTSINNAGTAIEREELTGRRIPELPPAPDLKVIKFGDPIVLFNGRDLTGWRLIEAKSENGWSVADGTLSNRPASHVAGQPARRFGNLRTEREFDDFNLKLEVMVPAGSNSGVYLRGIYEIQVFDSFGKPLDSHNMGALYSRIVPSVAAEKPASEWQTLDITLVNRHLTVLLNGITIIANQPIMGCTGGALWSDEFRLGPIYLQGDHGAVTYRNLILRPVVK